MISLYVHLLFVFLGGGVDVSAQIICPFLFGFTVLLRVVRVLCVIGADENIYIQCLLN